MKKSYSRKMSLLPLALTLCAASALAAAPAPATLPTGVQVAAGQAAISQSGSAMTINQATDKAILNWQTFNIGSQATVRFDQPSASAVALNRVLAGEASQIYGNLTANGQVYLVNPAGIVFGPGSRVDVGGLVASTLDITDADFLAGKRTFSRNNATGSITNQGEITAADGGLVALLAPTVVNEGVITARLGNVALAAGDRITLAAGADGLLQMAIDPATLQTLIDNRQLIVADGGQVLMTSKAADALSAGVVANSGTIQAHTLQEHEGRILLLADMEHGKVNLSGKLDASAPSSPLPLAGEGAGERANGGFVETSAAKVGVGDTARVTTLAANGKTGTWLIDPNDYTIAASGGNISGATLSANLGLGNVAILSSSGTAGGNGDIHVNDAVSWSANGLTLTAARDININAVMTASGTSTLTLNTATANGADAGVASGAVKVGFAPGEATGFAGRVDFPGRSGTGFLTINGQGYTVIDSLGAEGSTTGTDLQGISSALTGHFALGSNIDASATAGWNGGLGFLQLGDYGETGGQFTGVLDGLGHTIAGLTINRQSAPGFNKNYVGLFSYAVGATIRNVGLTGGSVTGSRYVGSLVGYLDADSKLSNVYNTGSVSGSGYGIGGLVGRNFGVISDAYNTGSVSGSTDVGGLVGDSLADSAIRNSYNTGGVAGYASVGGLVGSSAVNTVVSNSYYNIDSVAIEIDSSAQTGFVSRGGLYTAQYASWIAAGRRLDIADWLTLSGGSYLVGNYAGMQSLLGFAEQGYNFKLTADIVLQAGYYVPVLKGVLNGDGKQITGLNLNQPGQSYQGLFGMIASGSSVANVRVGNGYVYGRDYVGGVAGYNLGVIDRVSYSGTIESGGDYYNYYLGGLVGWNDGTLNNSSNAGNVIGGYSQIGGLVGRNYTSGIVSASYNSGNITNNGDSSIGGVVGTNDGTIVNAYNTGNITTTTTWGAVGGVVGFLNGGSLTNTYSTGSITADPGAAAGGLVGLNGGGTVSNSFWDTQTSGLAISDGGTDKTSAEMKQLATFAGWDIDATGGSGAVWRIYDGYTAPLLRNFLTSLTVTADNVTKTYDGNMWVGSLQNVIYSDPLAPDLLFNVLAPYADGGRNTGTYAPQLYADQQGYDISYVGGTLAVNPASLTVTGGSANNKTYDGTTAATVGGTLTGVIEGDGVSLSGAFDTWHAGTGKTVTFGLSGADAGNYSLSATTTANITPAGLTVTANDAGKTYDGNAYFGGNGVDYAGFVNNETADVLGGLLAYGGNSQGAVNVGSYAIIPSGLTAANYTIAFVNGALTINPTPLAINPAPPTINPVPPTITVNNGGVLWRIMKERTTKMKTELHLFIPQNFIRL